jgi:hypothetical protein
MPALPLRYGIIPVWGGDKERIKILRVQKKVTKLITGLKEVNPVERRLKKI